MFPKICAIVGLLLMALPAGAGEGSCWPGPPGSDPADCPPDDPRYARRWEFQSKIPAEVDQSRMHPRERRLGSIGISLDRAWQRTIGSDEIVIAVLDSGIRWGYRDLTRKLYLNSGELPPPAGSALHDGNGDGVFDVLDYTDDPRVGDRNGNGLLDPEDLILAFSDCVDDDGNGYPDDISGYDLFAGDHCGQGVGDNNPHDATDFGHGTGIASTAAAETNNGLRDAGVCPRCRVLPVRVGDSFVVDANRFARGVVFAVDAGATVIASALGAYNNPPGARIAVDYAYRHGVPIIASAADEFSYHHNYPSVYNHTLYVNAIRPNARDLTDASSFWGLNPCTNFGARVWLSVPAVNCSSGATSRLAGVVGLMASMAREAGIPRLHAEEIYQVLRQTADDLDNRRPDWAGIRYPARPGFDQLTGYGRLNADRAVAAVEQGKIPPIVDLEQPRWFAIVSPSRQKLLPVDGSIRLPRARQANWWLEYALGVEPREADYQAVAGGSITGEKRGLLGRLNFERLTIPRGPRPVDRTGRDAYSVTLRLRATDDAGQVAEARRSFFVIDDPGWMKHFPIDLEMSGEAGPVLADLDGRPGDEIVLPTADGYLRILSWSAAGVRQVRVPLDRARPLGPTATPASAAGAPRETVVRRAAIGDLRGDGKLSIVVGSREGSVYAFTPQGERLPGFPVSTARGAAESATPERQVESGLLAQPVLADLDGETGLEIIVSSLDGHVYAWNASGEPLPGFPVALANRHDPNARAKIISAPAVGDLDGDGRPEIVVGSNGLREGRSAAYAIRAAGSADPAGAFLAGWDPFEIEALKPDLLPTLAQGISMDPALVDVDGDGDLEAVIYAVTQGEILLLDQPAEGGPRIHRRMAMSPGPASSFSGISFLAGSGSPLLADTNGDGDAELYAPLLSMRLLTLAAHPGVPLDVPLALGGWNLAGDGAMLEGYPRRMEDLMIFARPAAADLDGDGVSEVLMGSGGYLLHAFSRAGGEAAGFPKFTGGWIFSGPAVGDLNGDGIPEVVVVTREGYLFAWTGNSVSMTR